MSHPNIFVFDLDPLSNTVCVVVGLGLIGNAIADRLVLAKSSSANDSLAIRLDWKSPDLFSQQLLNLVKDKGAANVELIWCAGKAGFSAREDALRKEFELLEKTVLGLQEHDSVATTVTLVSSAGGLYEGAGWVQDIKDTLVQRLYGEWKLKQELLLQRSRVRYRIFRLSTVYGPLKPGHRIGLVNVLLARAQDGGVANISSSPHTLRDYIYANDVARYIVDRLQTMSNSSVELIVSGRPTSVGSLIKLVTDASKKTIRVQYQNIKENDRDIVFATYLKPAGFRCSPLEETVRVLAARRNGAMEASSIPYSG